MVGEFIHPFVFLLLHLVLEWLTLLLLQDTVAVQDNLVREEPADPTVLGVGRDLLAKVIGPVHLLVERVMAKEIDPGLERNHVLIS